MKKLILFLTLLFVGFGANFDAVAQYSPSNNLNYIKLLKALPTGSVEDSVMVFDGSDSFVKMRPSSELITKATPTKSGVVKTNSLDADPVVYTTTNVDTLIAKKLNLPTGFLQGLQLSISADPTKFNIAPGYYVVTDFTNLANPVVKIITYPGATGLTPAYLATANSTYVALDINGNVVSSASPFTNADRRTLAIVGNVVHSNNTTINVTNEIKAPIVASINQVHDFMRAIGFLNEEGNIYSPNGANLQINKSAGKIFGMGINSADYLNPHQLSIPSQTALTFAYRLRGGTQYANTTSIDPNNWDNAGVLTSVPVGNRWTIQRINLFQSGLTRIQYGQTVYTSYNDAVTALPTQSFVTEQNIADNAVFRCYLIVKQGTTDLQAAVTAGTALFVPVDKFGNVIGNGSVALTYANIVAALGYTPENVANKATNFTTVNNTLYPTTQAVFNSKTVENNQINWDNKLLLNCGDSTTWQMTANGYGFDRMTYFHRLAGNQMEKITGYVNFGSSGYTLNGFVNDIEATPPTINTTSNLGIGAWDYYGHNVQIAISQKTAIAYRESIPNQEVVWSLCYGINDLILDASIGNQTQAQITSYIKSLLNTAIVNIRKKFPKDKIILRTPNPMAARIYNAGAGFPSASQYPTFGADKPTDVALVTKWNTALRDAYLSSANDNSNTILLDTSDKIFGSLSAEVNSDKRPFMGDLVHPNERGYIAIADEMANIFTDKRIQTDFSRIDEAEKKAILIPNAPYDNYASYLNNKTRYKLILNSNLNSISGSTYADVPFNKDEIDGKVLGRPFYLKIGNSAIKITSYTSTFLNANLTRLSSIVVSAEMQSSTGETSIYLDTEGSTDLWIKSQIATAKPRTVYYGVVGNGGSNFIDLSFDENTGRMSNYYRQGLENGTLIITTGSQTYALSSIAYSSYISENQIRLGLTGSFASSIGSQFAIYFSSSVVAPNQYEGIASTPLATSSPIDNGIKSFIVNNIDRFKGINIKASTNVGVPSTVTIDVYRNASNSRTLVGALIVGSNAYNSNTLTVTGTILQYETYEFIITSANTSVNDLLIFKIEPIL